MERGVFDTENGKTNGNKFEQIGVNGFFSTNFTERKGRVRLGHKLKEDEKILKQKYKLKYLSQM